MNTEQILSQANQAAIEAENNFLAKHGEPMYCGCAWVTVFVDRTNSTEAKQLLDLGFRTSHVRKCLTSGNVGGYKGQSLDVAEAGADAYAEVLRNYGFRAYSKSYAT